MGRKEKALLITLVANVVLVGLVFSLAAFSGSRALFANAWHAASDLFVGIFVLAGFLATRILEKSLSRKVTVVENVVSLVVGLLIFGVAYGVFIEAVRGPARELRNVPVVTLISLSTIAICYFISRYRLYVAQETGSDSLKALGYHSRMDIYTAGIVVAALVGYMIGLTGLDRAAAVIIVVLIVGTGWEILTTAVAGLATLQTAADVHGRGKLAEEVLQVLAERQEQGRRHPIVYYTLVGTVRVMGWLEDRIGRLIAASQSNRRRILRVVPGIVVLLYFVSGVYVVDWNQRGVIRRFGKKYAVTAPGLHYRLPPPIDRLDRVAVDEVRREDLRGVSLLTGDANIVDMDVAVHYVIYDPSVYLFGSSDPTGILRNAIKTALMEVAARDDTVSLLTTDRAALEQDALKRVQAMIAPSGAGIELINFQITRAWPPQDTVEAFRDVWSAREDKATYINEGQKQANKTVLEAAGEAARRVQEAEGYRADRVYRAQGEARRFVSRQAAYRLAPWVERKRLYLDTMEKVLPGTKKYIVDSSLLPGSTTDLWFSQGGELIRPVE